MNEQPQPGTIAAAAAEVPADVPDPDAAAPVEAPEETPEASPEQRAHDAAHAALQTAQVIDQATPGQPAVRGMVAKLEEVVTILRDLIG